MSEENYLPAESSEANAKKDVARNVAISGDAPSEDPSRATLHYGNVSRPELGGGDAAQPNGLSAEAPAEEVERPSEGRSEDQDGAETRFLATDTPTAPSVTASSDPQPANAAPKPDVG